MVVVAVTVAVAVVGRRFARVLVMVVGAVMVAVGMSHLGIIPCRRRMAVAGPVACGRSHCTCGLAKQNTFQCGS